MLELYGSSPPEPSRSVSDLTGCRNKAHASDQDQTSLGLIPTYGQIGLPTPWAWHQLSAEQKTELIELVADEYDLGGEYGYDWSSDLDDLSDLAAMFGVHRVVSWVHSILSDSTRCPRRRLVGKLGTNVIAMWIDCGRRECAHCSEVLAETLANKFAEGFFRLTASDEACDLYLVKTSSTTATNSLMSLITRKKAGGLRVPIDLGDTGDYVFTNLKTTDTRYATEFGDTYADALYAALLMVPAGARVKPNKILAEATTAAALDDQADAAAEDLDRDFGGDGTVAFRRQTIKYLVDNECVATADGSRWELEMTEEELHMVEMLNKPPKYQYPSKVDR